MHSKFISGIQFISGISLIFAKRVKGGMKKFIAYTIKHAENNGNIERRYKQFDWLDQRLTEQFPCSLRPQLPEKQASGRFEHEFIERRKVCL